MRKNLMKLMIVSILLTVFLASCKDDDPTYEKRPIENTELLAALQTKATNLTFENGMLVMNDAVANTKSLDLSGANLTSVKGLAVFANLETVNLSNNNIESSDALADLPAKVTSVNLAKNKFVTVFDFAKLPESVKSVDLSDNEIYDYQGLMDIDFEKGDIKVLRKLKKLILPKSAKFNVETLPFYFEENKDADMKMQNNEGKLEAYTTLREIPDEIILAILKDAFPNKFKGDKIDLSKNFSLDEKGKPINISFTQMANQIIMKFGKPYKNVEGIEYIINDPRYEGTIYGFVAMMDGYDPYVTSYLKPGKKFIGFMLIHISTPILDLSNAESLTRCFFSYNAAIKKVDLSSSKLFMRRGLDGNSPMLNGDMLTLMACPELEEVILPKDFSNTKDGIVSIVTGDFVALPKLKSLDLSDITSTMGLTLGYLPKVAEIKYPKKIAHYLYFNGSPNNESGIFKLKIDEETFKRPETKAFIKEHKEKIVSDHGIMTDISGQVIYVDGKPIKIVYNITGE